MTTASGSWSSRPSSSVFRIVLGRPPAELLVQTLEPRVVRLERLHDRGIEVASALLGELLRGDLPRKGASVGPVARHRVEGVGDGEDPRPGRSLLARETVRIAGSFPALVVRADDPEALALEQGDPGEEVAADHRVPAHHLGLGRAARTALPQA